MPINHFEIKPIIQASEISQEDNITVVKGEITLENATSYKELRVQDSYSDLFSNLNINENINICQMEEEDDK